VSDQFAYALIAEADYSPIFRHGDWDIGHSAELTAPVANGV
jgi:hypothetical protein